jgi:lipoyl(octanoyl) transferase
MMTATTLPSGVDWIVSDTPIDYPEALVWMEARATDVATGDARECIWLLEHPPLYTAGTSADPAELLDPRFPVFAAGRGGRYTYHGPGQRIGYLILDLNKRGRDVRCFVHAIEEWIIAALGQLGVETRRETGRIGIWTDDPDIGEAKIGAIGVRVRRWVSLHGFSINIAPDLSHFGGIIPCGVSQYGVTSLSKIGINCSVTTVDAALLAGFGPFLAALNSSQSA